ncbi:IPTL-CTERM sorting domain-containing protein [Comamonas piscis]|uniref:IPTL-CTERM sorting domain-containing protein n=1 Tax=Comamonas piscis TaxID=1562974 RepID=A0A7G5EH52_9BURK|nr:IPTL-CTERM sorting domain-containing protein [Comamonas piscis]QMV73327.1 IPTL-CTERM sorting domain-containing protein [Comamonas piscis]WSO36127.1 IPTL-CTERM sorting domain-containing protein [Comamonas piscis]
MARQGGGIYNNSGALAIHNSTISANQATDWGGGIFKTGAAPLVANSIIRGNSAPTNPDVVGAITSQNSSVYLANTADPGQPAISLYALGSYGGTMPTMPPLAGSPALALGRFVAGELDLDQVGAPRPSTVGAVIDAGAVQGQGYTVTIASPSPFPSPVAPGAALPVTVSVQSGEQPLAGVTPALRASVHAGLGSTASCAPSNASGQAACTVTFTLTGSAPVEGVSLSGLLGAASATSSAFTVAAQQLGSFGITLPAQVAAGQGFSFTVNALDTGGNPMPSYSGTLKFSSSDADGLLPADSTLTAGEGSFNATLSATGSQQITVADSVANPAIEGSASTQVLLLQPTVTGLTPGFADAAGGTVVTVTGSNFDVTARVQFAGFTYIDPFNVTPTSLSFEAPPGTAGNDAAVQVFTQGCYVAPPATNCMSPITPASVLHFFAASYVVNNPGDSDGSNPQACALGNAQTCTLRDAVLQANMLGGAPVIQFDPSVFSAAAPQTINLTNGQISLAKSMTIQGPGADAVTISGGGISRVLQIEAAAQPVRVAGLTLAQGSSNGGSAVLNHSTGLVQLQNLVLANNAATPAGYSGGNAALVQAGSGGAVYSDGTGVLEIEGSTFDSNSTAQLGGGLLLASGSTATLRSSTWVSNQGDLGGSALANLGSVAQIENSSFSANASPNAAGQGGTLFSQGLSRLVLLNSTVAGNSSGNVGGISGAADGSNTPSLSLVNSIVAGNSGSAGQAADIRSAGLTVSDGGGNVFTQDTPTTIDPGLAPLGNYGGNTQTLLALPGSRSICAGVASAAEVTVPTQDQRGAARPYVADGLVPASCVDAGAVQSHYAMQFSVQPSAVALNTPMLPAPQVSLQENGRAFNSSSYPALATLASLGSVQLAQGPGTGRLAKLVLAETPVSVDLATATGTAVFDDLEFAQAGSHSLVASLALNPSLAEPAVLQNSSASFAVGQSAAQISLEASPQQVQQGQAVTLTATVTGSAPGGTVTFSDGANVLCGGPVALVTVGDTATASCTTTALAQGERSITVSYSGDTNNAGAVSLTPSQVVVTAPPGNGGTNPIAVPALSGWALALLAALMSGMGLLGRRVVARKAD